MSIKLKLNLLLLVLGIVSSIAIAFFNYFDAKDRVFKGAVEKAELIHSFALASKSYTKDTMRPLARKIAGEDSFRPELMSGFFVARSISDIFSKSQPGYSFKAATNNPIKIENMVDSQEMEILVKFQENRDLKLQKGTIEKGNEDYFYIARPSVAKKGCLKCHGQKQDAPKEQLEMYTGSYGYNYVLDEVVAIFITYVPVQKALNELKITAFKTVMIGIFSILFILVAIWYFMNSTITKPIIHITGLAESMSRGKGLDKEVVSNQKGEIGALYNSFNRMRKSVVMLIKMNQKKKS